MDTISPQTPTPEQPWTRFWDSNWPKAILISIVFCAAFGGMASLIQSPADRDVESKTAPLKEQLDRLESKVDAQSNKLDDLSEKIAAMSTDIAVIKATVVKPDDVKAMEK